MPRLSGLPSSTFNNIQGGNGIFAHCERGPSQRLREKYAAALRSDLTKEDIEEGDRVSSVTSKACRL